MRGRLPTIVLLAAAGAVAVYFASRAGGSGAAVAAVVALACAVVLGARATPVAVDAASAQRLFDIAVLALPAALTLFLAFSSGGFFPGAPAGAAIVLVVVLVLRVTLVEAPFAGWSWPLAVAAGGLGAHAVVVLVSGGWSDAEGRALVEFDRALLYLLVLVLVGSVPRTPGRLRWALRGVAAAIVVVAGAAVLTRLFADTFPTFRNLGNQQLSWPLTYSNALGMLCALGLVACLHLASCLREALVVRALAAAAMPLLAVALYLTLSRGPVYAGAGGLAVYVVLGRPRGLASALLAAVPVSVLAVAVAYDNALLTSVDPSTPAALEQGEHVAKVLLACMVGAALLRVVLAPVDARLDRIAGARRLGGRARAVAWGAAAAAAIAVALAAGAPGWLGDRYDAFVSTDQPDPSADIRRSVLTGGNRGLIDNWDIALEAFRDAPLRGEGAGSFETSWNLRRPFEQGGYDVSDAHSLYLEQLAEVGVAGTVPLVLALLAVLLALSPLGAGRDRALHAALLALGLSWAVHAGIEWDWEMPAVTAWLFGLGGAALAAPLRAAPRAGPSQGARVAAGAALLAIAVAPGLVLASQRQVEASTAAFDRRDCPASIERAAAAIETLEVRPEPYELIAHCQARNGEFRLAVDAMREAARRDPGNWRLRYSLAVVRGAAGLDPWPAVRAAQRINPRGAVIAELATALRAGGRAGWRGVTEPLARAGKPTVFR